MTPLFPMVNTMQAPPLCRCPPITTSSTSITSKMYFKNIFICYKVTLSETVTTWRSLKTISSFNPTLTINSEINKTRMKLMSHFSLLFLQHFFSHCSSFFGVGVTRQSQSEWLRVRGLFFSAHTLQRRVFGFVSIREDELHNFLWAFILL